MTSYNSIDGRPATASGWLLQKKLKQDMGFKGFVISDAAAVGGANVLHYTAADYADASAQAVNNGLDVIFQTAYDHYKLFIPPFLDGRVNKTAMDEAVKRVLRVKFELGLFEQPYAEEGSALAWSNRPEHRQLTKEAAVKSIVLLKNDNHLLPLQKNATSIAVIGTDATEARLGGYSGPGNNKVNILQGIQNITGKNTRIIYEPGCGRQSPEYQPVAVNYLLHTAGGKQEGGLVGEYFSNITLAGKPILTRTDAAVDFRWTLYSPHPDLPFGFYSVRWSGKLKAPGTGLYKIGIEGNDGYRLFLNGRLVIDNWKKRGYSSILEDYRFEAGKEYAIRVEFFESSGPAWFKLVWNAGVKNNWQQQISKAVDAARKADVAIVVAGIEEGEGQDRARLNLPGHQEEMISHIAATGKPVVVVLIGGSAITMSSWLGKVTAVIDAWYPGEEGGNAVAAILFGDETPSGKLPITFPLTEGQLPLVYNHRPTGRNDDYVDETGQPLFPFGFGLSYTWFDYSDMRLDKGTISRDDSVMVSVAIKNTGSYTGEEVVQLYLRHELASVVQPVKSLKGFQRIRLAPGEGKRVAFWLTPGMLSILDEKMNRVVEPGRFRIMIGASSSDIRLMDVLTVY
jgi:beta-glucosidase